jgi:FKBP-type peptidyl-prolyl cis-trans isomerase SlyD
MQALMFYQFDYAILDDEGNIVDSSKGGEPLSFIQGDGTMIKGLEKALRGKETGDKFTVSIRPEDAYGWPQRSLIRTVSGNMFQGSIDDVEVGALFQVGSGSEAEVVKVVSVEEDGITVDSNHPLAGLTLNFDIAVVVAREATLEEIENSSYS